MTSSTRDECCQESDADYGIRPVSMPCRTKPFGSSAPLRVHFLDGTSLSDRKSRHQLYELFRVNLQRFLFIPGPPEISLEESLVEEKPSIGFLEQSLDAVASLPPEEEKRPRLERHAVVALDDRRKTLYSLAHVCSSAHHYDLLELFPCRISKHRATPSSLSPGFPL